MSATWSRENQPTLAQWLELQELPCVEKDGYAHQVLETSAIFVTTEDGQAAGLLPAVTEVRPGFALGIAIVEAEDGSARPFRLPLPLGQWALEQWGMMNVSSSPFPLFLGMKRLDDDEYEFVLVDRSSVTELDSAPGTVHRH